MATSERARIRSRTTLDAVRAELAERQLKRFVRDAWHVVEPVARYQHNWHIDAICEHLEAVSRFEIPKLVINIPPRHMKSLTVSVFWPAWEWIHAPHRRFLYASYAEKLSIKHSVLTRRVIQSAYYQQRWGARFALAADQNVKTKFETTDSGMRLATSVGGVGTGEGGDFVVCLPGETRITTDRGELPIGQIVEQQIPVRVLGPSGWQEIEAFEKNPGRALVEIETAEGILRCTEDHRIWIEGRGWRPAKDVTSSVDGEVFLRQLRPEFRPIAGPCEAQQENVLLSQVLRGDGARGQEHGMVGGAGHADLQGLPGALPGQARQERQSALLLLPMPRSMAARAAANRLPDLRHHLYPFELPPEVLLARLRGQASWDGNTRGAQRALDRRPMADPVCTGLHEHGAAQGQGPRRQQVCDLPVHESAPGASHQSVEERPPVDESGDPLHLLPQNGAHEDWAERALDEPIRVIAAHRCAAPDFVYNLRVAPDHAYYAEGLLVHNCDDAHNVSEGESKQKREAVIDWWDAAMSSRVNNPSESARVIIMQRVHEGDLAGHLLEQGWTALCLPAEYSPAHPYAWRGDPRKETGELLWPERFDESWLEEKKVELGSYQYAGQYQQLPSPAEGGILKRGWWGYYEPGDWPQLEEIVQSWDLTFKDTDGTDFVVGQTWGRDQANKYLLRSVRERMDFTTTLKAMEREAAWAQNLAGDVPVAILVEDKANGPAVINTLRRKLSGMIAVEPKGGKEARAHAVSPQIEAGNVYLPGARALTEDTYDAALTPAWVQDFIEEATSFPRAAHDDQVDAMSQALLRLGKARKHRKPRTGGYAAGAGGDR